MTNVEKNARIVKNTAFLYLRMILMMLVSLYTSRIILQSLGVEDFGIYNVVAGIVVLFSFVSNAMALASQRFLSFSIGKNIEKEINRIFCMSLTTHIIIIIFVIIIAETIGLFILYKMNFPNDRVTAIGWVYQIAIVTCCINIVRVPYNALIIAYEQMSFYAWISIIEAVLKLVIVFFLTSLNSDKLISYSFLLLFVTFLVDIFYFLYCKKQFSVSKYHFIWDRKLLTEFANFSGWSLAGSLASVGVHQGLNMIINIFFGVTVNAAVGISNQVMGVVSQFLSNFQTAFNPQLVKSYAKGDTDYFINLIFKSSKISFFLMLIIALPILVNCHFFLDVWLDTVPEYATSFSQLMIIFLLVESISGPLWMAVQATGKIKGYQLMISILLIINIPISLFFLYKGFSPTCVFVVRVILNFVALLARILYLGYLINFQIKKFLYKVMLPILEVGLLSIIIPLILYINLDINWKNVFLISFVCVAYSLVLIYFIGLNAQEKNMITHYINKYKKNVDQI